MNAFQDYLRYTFTPATTIVLVMGALAALTAIVVFAICKPLLIVIIFCVYVSIFITAMVLSLFAWIRYRKFYNSVFHK